MWNGEVNGVLDILGRFSLSRSPFMCSWFMWMTKNYILIRTDLTVYLFFSLSRILLVLPVLHIDQQHRLRSVLHVCRYGKCVANRNHHTCASLARSSAGTMFFLPFAPHCMQTKRRYEHLKNYPSTIYMEWSRIDFKVDLDLWWFHCWISYGHTKCKRIKFTGNFFVACKPSKSIT